MTEEVSVSSRRIELGYDAEDIKISKEEKEIMREKQEEYACELKPQSHVKKVEMAPVKAKTSLFKKVKQAFTMAKKTIKKFCKF